MDNFIEIHTLGEFSITYKNHSISDQENRTKKVWTLIEYIILNHSSEITTDTIINLLWPADNCSQDPINALKVCLHRAREVLATLDYPVRPMIINKRNTLSWNKAISYTLDCEQFEGYCQEASEPLLTAEQQIELYEKAFALYKGDFLPKASGDDWAVPITTYYHTLYVQAAQIFLQLLYLLERFDQLVFYAYQAIRIEEYDETIQYYLILGLYRSGNTHAALTQYDHILHLLYDEFGVNPSEQLRNLYKEIIKSENATQTDLNLIQEDLKEKATSPCAYQCDYSIFQHLYQIQARSMERTGLNFYLCLITMESVSKKDTNASFSKAMNSLSGIISKSLRSGDVYSRYSINQYILLLPSTSYENASIVGERIMKVYNALRSRHKLPISYRLKCMEPQLFDKEAE